MVNYDIFSFVALLMVLNLTQSISSEKIDEGAVRLILVLQATKEMQRQGCLQLVPSK